jgi:hypothetical protein
MDIQHDIVGLGVGQVEEMLQHMHDKLHRRVVIIHHQNFIHRRFSGFGVAVENQLRLATAIITIFPLCAKPMLIHHFFHGPVCHSDQTFLRSSACGTPSCAVYSVHKIGHEINMSDDRTGPARSLSLQSDIGINIAVIKSV